MAVSLIVTPYGGWIFDLPVLLVTVAYATARLAAAKAWALVGVLVLGQVAITVASFAWAGALHAYWWVAPAALVLCVPTAFARRRFS